MKINRIVYSLFASFLLSLLFINTVSANPHVVTGVVIDELQGVIEGALVQAINQVTGDVIDEDITAPGTGIYALDLDTGVYSFLVVPPSNSNFAELLIEDIVIDSDEVIDFILIPLLNSITIDGYVNDSHGDPIRNQEVFLSTAGSTLTAENGYFSFDVAPGDHTIRIQNISPDIVNAPTRYHLESFPITFEESETLEILLPTKRIVVVVTDQGGNRIPGVELRTSQEFNYQSMNIGPYPARPGDSWYYYPVTTDSSGEAVMWLYPNSYEFTATPPDGTNFLTTVETISIQEDSIKPITLEENLITIDGYVNDSHGDPIRNQEVFLSTAGSTLTAENGYFSFDVAPGDHTIRIQNISPDIVNAPTRYHLESFPITFEESETLEILLPTKRIVVVVTDQGGNRIPGVELRTSQEFNYQSMNIGPYPARPGDSWYYYPVTTDSSGEAVMWLYPNSYELTATPPQGSDLSVFYVDSFNVETDKTVFIKLESEDPLAELGDGFYYVIGVSSDNLSVHDLKTQTQLKTIGIGRNPVDILFSHDRSYAFISDSYDKKIVKIETKNHTIVDSKTYDFIPDKKVFSIDGNIMYVGGLSVNMVALINPFDLSVIDTIPLSDSPGSIDITPDGSRLFVSYRFSGEVQAIDTSTKEILGTITLGGQPTDVTISPDGQYVFVSSTGTGTSDVISINASTYEILDRVEVNIDSLDVLITPDGRYLFVPNHAGIYGHTVTVIDTADVNNLVIAKVIETGTGPSRSAMTPDGKFVFSTNSYSHDISIIDVDKMAVIDTVPAGVTQPVHVQIVYRTDHPEPVTEIAFDPPANPSGEYSDPETVSLSATAYEGYQIANIYYKLDGNPEVIYTGPFEVSGLGEHTIEYWSVDSGAVIEDHKTATYVIGEPAAELGDGFYYVIGVSSDNLSVHDLKTQTQLKTIGIGRNPVDILFSHDRSYAFISDSYDKKIVKIETKNHTIVDSKTYDFVPARKVFSLDGNIMYVGGLSDNMVALINPFDLSVIDTIPLDDEPGGIDITPDGSRLFVSYRFSGEVQAIDTSTKEILGTITLGGQPTDVKVSPDGQYVYVTSTGTGTSDVISIDADTYEILDREAVNIDSIDILITPDGRYLFVPNHAGIYGHTVTVIDTADVNNLVIAKVIETGTGPSQSAMTPDGKFVFSTNSYSHDISIIDVDKMAVIDTVPAGVTQPVHVQIVYRTDHPEPVTEIAFDPPANPSGEYTAPLTISLNAVAQDGYQIANTYYKLDGNAEVIYDSPLEITETGEHTIEYWSVDSGAVIEDHKTATYVIVEPSGPSVCLYESDGVTGIADSVVQFYNGGWQLFGTTGDNGCISNAIPLGSYKFRVTYGGATQDITQDISIDPLVVFTTVNATVELKDANGVMLDGGVVQYYAGGWNDFGTTSGGQVSKELLPGSYKFRMNYAGSTQEVTQDITIDPVVIFTIPEVMVEFRDSGGNLLDGGFVQYYASGWKDIGYTVNGQISVTLPAGSYKFRMNYGGATQDITQDISVNPLVEFETIAVTVELRDSIGDLLGGGVVQYYAGGWKDFGELAGGTVEKELLPGSYKFRVTYGGATQDITQDISIDPLVVFTTVNATVELKDANGVMLDGGVVQYYAGGWNDFGTTSGGQVSKELLPGSYKFRMNYAGSTQEVTQDITIDPVVVFTIPEVMVEFRDSGGNLLDGGFVQYYASGWKDIGYTVNGQISVTLPAGSYKFRMNYGGATQDITQDISVNPLVEFETIAVTVELRDSIGDLLGGGVVQYYAGGWKDFGELAGGTVEKELLPGSYKFRVTYGGATQDITQDISIDPLVVYRTGSVISDSDTCISYYAGGWKEFSNPMELLGVEYKFRFNDGTEDTFFTIIPGGDNHIH